MSRAVLLLLVAAAAGGCRSRSIRHARSSADELGAELVGQLEARADTRRMRLLVREFDCAGPRVPVGRRARWDDDPVRFRVRLVTALAQRVHVVEGPDALACWPGPDPCVDARAAGATAVLVGSYTVVDRRRLLVQARVLDAESSVVLAAAEKTVRR